MSTEDDKKRLAEVRARAHQAVLTADTARVSVAEVLSAQLIARERERDEALALVRRLEARCAELEGELHRFLAIADHCVKVEDESNARAARMQEAAVLARAGRQEEAFAIRDAIDRQPRVWDFSNTVFDLRKAAKLTRRALSGSVDGGRERE